MIYKLNHILLSLPVISLLVLFPSVTFSQLLNINNTSVTIVGGTDLYVLGDIVANGTTSIDNEGSIVLSGDWSNNSNNNCFGISQGTVTLNGGVQVIGGSESTLFNNLNLAGTGTKVLNQNISTGGGSATPNGVLNLNDRILNLNTNKLTINNSNPTAIIRTTGFIESETDAIAGYGTIVWLTGTITNGSSFTFPFGNTASSDYIPVIMNFTNGSVSPAGSFSISTYPTNTSLLPNNRPLPTGLPVLTNFAGAENAANTLDRFWIIESNDYTINPVADITLSYRDSEWNTGNNSIVENTLRAQRHDLISWSVPPGGTINTISNNIVVSGVSSYNHIWALAGEASPLPVEFLSFTASQVNNKEVICNWITATELNNDYFTLEKSRNGIDFEFVAEIDGAGNSLSTISYAFTDTKPFTGLSYYRLIQTDYDGLKSYSKTVSVTINSTADQYYVFPNPTFGQLNIQFSHHTNGYVEIFDAPGKLVLKKSFSESNLLELNLSFLNSGLYSLIIHSGTGQAVHKVIKN